MPLYSLAIGMALLLQMPFAWGSGGLIVGPHPARVPIAAPDGVGGAFIEWDNESSAATRPDVLGQHITASGMIAVGWPAQGISLGVTPRDESPSRVVAGAAGDSYWLWHVNETDIGLGGSLYLSRRTSTGEVAPGWPAGGLIVKQAQAYSAGNWVTEPQAASDGQGGVLIGWEEEYFNTSPMLASTRALRVRPNGSVAAGWPDSGVTLGLPRGITGQYLQQIVPDGGGGGFFVWVDGREYSTSVPYSARAYVKRLGADGSVSPGWPSTGLRLGPSGTGAVPVGAMSDGHGGLFVAWEDYREGPPSPGSVVYGDVYLQHLTGDGQVVKGWPADGLPIHTGPGAQWYPVICPDGEDGVFLAWEDYNTGRNYVMRVTSSGAPAPGWPAGGKIAATPLGYSDPPRLVSDGNGGMYVGWIQGGNSSRAYVQHFLHDGSFAPGFGIGGTLLMDVASSSQTRLVLIGAEPGAAIAIWDNFDRVPTVQGTVRAQKLVSDGLVAIEMALESVERTSAGLHLRWAGTRADPFERFVERSADGIEWIRLGAAVEDGEGRLSYFDSTAPAGTQQGYRLVDPAGQAVTMAAWVEVPARLVFALAGAVPNPARARALTVQFTLAERGAGTLELLDVAGRRLVHRDIGGLAAGQHRMALPGAATAAPGVHWLRLRQGGNVLERRVVLTQ